MPVRITRKDARPTEATRQLGNPGHRKLPNALTVIALPAADIEFPPEELMTEGMLLIRNILEAGARAWISTTDQMSTLVMLAKAWDERLELREFVRNNGYSYRADTQSGHRFYAYPEVTQLREVEAQITTWLSELGLTPMARSKLGVAEVKAASKLEQMRERRAERKSASGE